MQKVKFLFNITNKFKVKFFDIAANLSGFLIILDNQFKGEYYGKKHHEDDTKDVI